MPGSSEPLGPIKAAVVPGSASQPQSELVGFSTTLADWPAIMYSCATKLGPVFDWNIRSPRTYCFASNQYGSTSCSRTYENANGEELVSPPAKPSIFP